MKKDGRFIGDVELSVMLAGIKPRIFDAQCYRIYFTDYHWVVVYHLSLCSQLPSC